MTFPHTLGIDVAGTVAELGEGVQVPAVGDAVIGFLPLPGTGAAAEFVVAPAAVLVPAPENVPLADAAAIPVAALTAWQALFELGGLTSGQRVLINGAGGGRRRLRRSARRRGRSRRYRHRQRPQRRQTVRSFGAGEVIDYTASEIGDAVREPVDLVVNLVAGDERTRLRCLTSPGRVASSFRRPRREESSQSSTCGLSSSMSAATLPSSTQIVQQIEAGALQLDVSDRRPLAETPLVHEQSESGAVRGRVVFVPGDVNACAERAEGWTPPELRSSHHPAGRRR